MKSAEVQDAKLMKIVGGVVAGTGAGTETSLVAGAPVLKRKREVDDPGSGSGSGSGSERGTGSRRSLGTEKRARLSKLPLSELGIRQFMNSCVGGRANLRAIAKAFKAQMKELGEQGPGVFRALLKRMIVVAEDSHIDGKTFKLK